MSTISDLGHGDYGEWFIGHSASTYYRKSDAEKIAIFKKIEPYLTYLDYSSLDAKGADFETKLQEKDDRITNVEQQSKEIRESQIKSQANIMKMLKDHGMMKAAPEKWKEEEKALGD